MSRGDPLRVIDYLEHIVEAIAMTPFPQVRQRKLAFALGQSRPKLLDE
jgi:hypothetical protein